MSESIGNFLCAICEKVVIVDSLNKVEDFRIGIHLFCPDCREEITMAVMRRFIEDATIPKTYRATIEQYLKWRKKNETML